VSRVRRDLLVLLASLAVFALCAVMVADGRVGPAERVAKLLVERERPGTTVPDAILHGVPSAGLSFVSGHAIITFAIAGLLVLVLPRRWGITAFVLATLNWWRPARAARPSREEDRTA
jgi:membrane-associated phospholipid phosphatase